MVRLLLVCLLIGMSLPAEAQEKWSLAPGVLTTIPPNAENSETFSGPLAIALNAPQWTPNYVPQTDTLAALAKEVTLRRPVWNLEFSFKPLRMVEVDVPVGDRLERKLVWYMVYRLRYLGEDLQLSPQETRFGGQKFPAIDRVNLATARRFFPTFVLEETQELKKSYLDRIVPAAKEVILRREFSPNRTENPERVLYNTVEISSVNIELSTGRMSKPVWGVVTWIDVDPRVDYFSIYIQGLTNAFRIEVQDGKPVRMTHKELKLNFWRPGDSVQENEEEIRYGIPVLPDSGRQEAMIERYGQTQRLDYMWIYR